MGLSDANHSRSQAFIQRKSISYSTVPEEMATEPAMWSAVQAHSHIFASSKYEGVEDERVVVKELSLGHRMLQVAGIVPGARFAGAGVISIALSIYCGIVSLRQWGATFASL